MKTILEFDHVSFRYPGEEKRIFEDLSFSLEQGEFMAVIGPSGSGKSTIFRLINNFNVPESGLCRKPDSCGYMPQHDLLFPWYTVEENVSLPLRIRKVPKKDRREETAKLLDRVGLSDAGAKYPRELSGGMRQRAAFARTLATGSDLLLLDEPFSALDAITRKEMQEWLLNQWKTMDKTILLITHDVEEAVFLAQRVLVLTEKPVRQPRIIRIAESMNDKSLKDKRSSSGDDGNAVRSDRLKALKEELTGLLRGQQVGENEKRS